MRNWSVLSGLVCVLLFSGCLPQHNDVSNTPNVPNWGSTPTNREQHLPVSLDCSQISIVKPGPSWSGLTIGISSLEDVNNRFAPSQGEWDTQRGNYSFLNTYSSRDDTWSFVQTCFTGNTLSAMHIVGSEDLERPLSSWLDEYSNPNLVTWGGDYGTRSLVWASEGLLVVIDLYSDYSAYAVLFSPLSRQELASSWVVAELPTEGYENHDVLQRLTPEKEMQDPWGIQH